MKKVLVTGVSGQLGFDVIRRLNVLGVEALGADIAQFDITDAKATHAFIKDYMPTAVIHCSAYTAVDKAESDILNCRKVNVDGAENIAKACASIGAEMIYVSTDYVYAGSGEKPFEVTDETAPLNVYGLSKLDGENACKKHLKALYIVRTSWVFGKNGNNFIKTMLRLAKEREFLNVVSDQIGSPTYTVDLADFLCFLLDTKKYGTYHFTNEGFCSWHEFACEAFKLSNVNIKVNKVATEDYKTAAARPKNSRLSKECVYKLGYKKIPTWQDALKRYLEEL